MLNQRQWARVTWFNLNPENIQKKKMWKRRSNWCLGGGPTTRSMCWSPTVNQMEVLTQSIYFSRGSSFVSSQMGLRPAEWSLGFVSICSHPCNPPLPPCFLSPLASSSLFLVYISQLLKKIIISFAFPSFCWGNIDHWKFYLSCWMLCFALQRHCIYTHKVVQLVLFSKYIQAVLIIPSTIPHD